MYYTEEEKMFLNSKGDISLKKMYSKKRLKSTNQYQKDAVKSKTTQLTLIL